MLDAWLSVTHRAESVEQEKRAFVEDLKKLPVEVLHKLASGELTIDKLAHGCSGPEWLEKFEGTPMFEQALALEQQELQIQSERLAAEMNRPRFDDMYQKQDQLSLQKRLLEMQLIADRNKAPSPEAPAQGAGAPGPGAANNEEAMSTGPFDGLKMSSAETQFAETMGRKLAQADAKKASESLYLANLDKVAFLSPAALQGLKSVGTKALNVAKANPLATGGAIAGGLGGMYSGLTDQEGGGIAKGIGRGLMGAAAGGTLGMVAQVGKGVYSKMTGEKAMGLSDALRSSANQQIRRTGKALGYETKQVNPYLFKTPKAAT